MLNYLTINILMRTGNNDRVLQKFDSLPELTDYFPFYYLYYLAGESHLRKLETDQAAKNLSIFLDNFKGQNFIKDAYRKLAWTSLLEGDTTGYEEILIQVKEYGTTNVGQDNDAQREAQSGSIPDAELIKVRLLFDGGYYKQADSVLNQIDTTTLKKEEKIEVVYRKARIAHQTKDLLKATTYYRKAIEIGKNSPRYFAGNSALKLGEIYEIRNELDLAEYYFRFCLNLDFDEFESGIHTKAKAALKRISG
jgi:tetratricopeptide (TPR) repeat protein